MRLARFFVDGAESSGLIEGDRVYALRGGDVLGGAGAIDVDLFDLSRSEDSWPLGSVKLLAPVFPSKIIAIGLNYKAHAAEFDKELPNEPMLFLKPPSSVIGPADGIVYPSHMSRRVDYEGELAVVIGTRTRHVEPSEAGEYILGYTCFNDVTARDLQGRDIQYTRAKGFDTFAPIGPWIETELEPTGVMVESCLNGDKRQSTSTSDMIFDCFTLVSFVSKVMTLSAGDVIATGTPSGVGKMKPGDEVTVRIEGIGELVNTVVSK